MTADKEVHRKLDTLLVKTAGIEQHLTDMNGSIARHENGITDINIRCAKRDSSFKEWKGATNVKIAVLSGGSAIIGGLIHSLASIL